MTALRSARTKTIIKKATNYAAKRDGFLWRSPCVGRAHQSWVIQAKTVATHRRLWVGLAAVSQCQICVGGCAGRDCFFY